MPDFDELSELLIEAATISDYIELCRDPDLPRWWYVVNEEQLTMMEWDSDGKRLLLTAEVLKLEELPEEAHRQVLKRALCYNALWAETAGGRMAMLPEDESLQLMAELAEDELSVAAVSGLVTTLLDSAAAWADACRELRADGAEPPPTTGASSRIRV